MKWAIVNGYVKLPDGIQIVSKIEPEPNNRLHETAIRA